jgi:hypothetical protein
VGSTRQHIQQPQNFVRDLSGHSTNGDPFRDRCQPYLAIEIGPAGDSDQPCRRAGLCICEPGVAPGGMAFHKFKIGQRVSFRPSRDDLSTTYVVTALLPERNSEFKYCLLAPSRLHCLFCILDRVARADQTKGPAGFATGSGVKKGDADPTLLNDPIAKGLRDKVNKHAKERAYLVEGKIRIGTRSSQGRRAIINAKPGAAAGPSPRPRWGVRHWPNKKGAVQSCALSLVRPSTGGWGMGLAGR